MNSILKELIVEWQEMSIPKMIKREIKLRNKNHITAIVGPRRVGKTYLLFQLAEKYKKESIYIDFEDYRLINFTSKDISKIIESFIELYNKNPKYLFFDEIQNLDNWGRVLRTLHNQGYKIFITGSSSKLLISEISTELRGRYDSILLLPFSFKEVLKLNKIETKNISYSKNKARLLRLFSDYLDNGGFPEVLYSDDAKSIALNYFQTTFYRDLIERHNIKSKHILEFLLRYLLDNYSRIISISKLENTLKSYGINVSKRTISLFLYYIKESFFSIFTEKFSNSPRKRMLNPKKSYLIDNSLTLLSLKNNDKGFKLENVVAIELFRRGIDFFYYRDKYECDFIFSDTAIQVTLNLNEENKKRELLPLEHINAKNKLVLTYDQEMDFGNIKVIPVWKWLLG